MKTILNSVSQWSAILQLLKKLYLWLIISAAPILLHAQEMSQNTVSNGAGMVSGGNYTGYVSIGQMATYMFANGSQIATQGIILNEITGDVEFTFVLSGNLTANNNTNAKGLVLKSSAAELIGDPLGNTKVYLILVETGEVYDSTLTNSGGYFEFLNVPYLDFYFVLYEPIIPGKPVLLTFEESTVFVKDVEINGEVGTEGLTAEVEVTPQATTVPEEQTKSMYIDKDKDGFGFGSVKIRLNSNASEIGYADNNADCDDNDPTIYPGADEVPGSGIDANCDGFFLWYSDIDNDGLGTLPVVESTNSEPGEGEANNSLDEDDTNSLLCDAIEVILDNTGQAVISSKQISIFNSGDVSFLSTPSVFDCSNIGNPVKTLLSVSNLNGDQKYCGAEVTVVGTVPNVTISESILPEFCQGAVLRLAAESEEAVTYNWSNGADSEITEITKNGIYEVSVTSTTGCTANATYLVNGFEASALLSSYTLIAKEEVHLHNTNIVASGGVGVTKEGKTIKLHEASQITDFAKASRFEITDGSTIGFTIAEHTNVAVPAFIQNTRSKRNSKSVKVKKRKTVTLSEEVYGKIEIEEGATVIFSASDIYIEEIKTRKGAKVEFENCARLYVKKAFKLEENCIINSGGAKVVFFVDAKVEIEKGSFVTAGIHANDNDIHVHGDMKIQTSMKGMFIGKKIHGDKNVIWNMNPDCSPCELSAGEIQIDKSGEIASLISTIEDNLDFKAYPNPTHGRVTLEINPNQNIDFKIRIQNSIGQKIFEQSYVPQNRIELDLTGNTPGIYFIQMVAGETQITKKIILQNE